MQRIELRRSRDDASVVKRVEKPLLTFADSSRSNEDGTLWAFGEAGRPLAFLELYRHVGSTHWVHALTLTSLQPVSMVTPLGTRWAPERTQIEPAAIGGAPLPDAKEAVRLRQLKELARRFTGHEFWDPDNSKFELRLLVQPVHRYSDPKTGLHDGAAFTLAHGTNPEIVLLIEALGPSLAAARWHFSVAPLGSAELHVALDDEEVWKRDRTPGVVGRPADSYWLFLSPVETDE
jgi:hypothetical protein